MKRVLFSAAMFLCSLLTFAQFSGSGSGTENDPYLIFNPIQLNQLRNFLNAEGVYFKMMADVDLTEYLEDESPQQGWQPVGNSSSAAFKGILDGNGKTISGLWIKRQNTDYVGFIGYASNAIIKNLKIIVTSITGNANVGGVVGYSESSTFDEIYFSGNIRAGSCVGGIIGGSKNKNILSGICVSAEISGYNSVGGIVGENSGNDTKFSEITNCRVFESKISGNDCVGGACGNLVGWYASKLESCFVYADVIGCVNVGGICGNSTNRFGLCNMENCGFSGNVEGVSCVGGLQGSSHLTEFLMGNTINNCFSFGRVSASGDYVGGLVGYDEGYVQDRAWLLVSNCYFTGMVSGKNYTGALIGFKKYGTVSSCYSRASVIGNKYVGGLIGYYDGKDYSTLPVAIKTSVANNTQLMAKEGEIALIIGHNNGRVSSIGTTEENKSYNKTIVIKSGIAQDIYDNEQSCSSVSATTLKLKATYVAMGWDFTNIWDIQETECYPYFKTQTAPPVITSQVASGATTISGKCIDGGLISLEVDGVTQQMTSTGNNFSFNVSPLQAGHEVHICAKAEGKEQSYFATELVSYLGSGTELDPYQIYTASDLTGVYRKGYFKLMNNIDLTDYINQFSPTEGWQSIGRDGSETIHFDGNGHKITGLWCNSARDNTGLFSCFANGNIKDLTVETAAGKQVKGGANTGILIGKMINGTIENCKVTGTVADGTPVGGMVGLFDGGEILKCQASVSINTTASTTYAGGLVGEITGGEINQCYTDGSLTTSGNESYAGGLVGKNSGTITNSYSSAAVASSYNAAGLVAYNFGVVDKCMASGNLYSNNYAAGVIGYNDGAAAVISNSVALNNIIDVTYESQQTQQGGGYGQRIIGGIKNGAPAPEMNNYALSTMLVSVNDVPQIVYNDIMNGTAKTDAELKQKTTYQTIGWDFDNVWNIDEGASYPYQTIQMNNGSGPNDPNDPDGPDNPDEPQGKVDVTDVSQIANVIYIEPMEARTGTQATISLKMKNTAPIRAFQFDLYLPEGVTAVKSAKGRIQGFLSAGRLPDEDEHTLSFSEQPDGAIRFLCGSEYDETFTGNDGEIATLLVNIADNIADGDYPIQLKGMKLTETDISKYYETALIQSKLTISTYVIGDINGDGVVDVSDYTGVANHIHNNTPAGFNAKAADVDESGGIDVSDYTGIANIIHTGSIYGNNSNARMMVRGPRKVNTDLSSKDNVIYVKPLAALAGSQTTISVKMKNTAEIRSFQFDLQLPDGVTVVKSTKGKIQGSLSAGRLPEDDEHTLSFSEHEGNVIRFLCGSLSDETFTGNDGEIATLQVDVAANVEAEDHTVYLRNMKLSESDISKFYQTEELGTTLAVAPEGSARGDANGDKSVSVTDIAVVVNEILQITNSGGFLMYGADANGDGDITVTDIGVIVDKILGTNTSASSRKMEQEVEPQ